MFRVWFGELHRPTLDADLLGHVGPEPEAVEQVVRELLATNVPDDVPDDGPDDGLEFDLESVRAAPIRGGQEYPGVRVKCEARLGTARVPVQLDIGFGDVVVPSPITTTLPALLDHDPPKLEVYTPESLVAEKLHALVVLGIANSRMKDFFDLLEVSKRFEIRGEILAEAIRATFDRRATPIPETVPTGLTASFAADPGKRGQWIAFVGRIGAEAPLDLDEVVAALSQFLLPPMGAAREDRVMKENWSNESGWT